MILIPEIKTIVIMPPRTASGSIKNAIKERYPESYMLYRHMEADGVPFGYDRWQKVGLCREPLERLFSLYQFCLDLPQQYHPPFMKKIKNSVQKPFQQWIIENSTVFTEQYDTAGSLQTWPRYAVLHAIPETKKSQFIYLRPDLGTEVFRFDHLQDFFARLDIQEWMRNLPWKNATFGITKEDRNLHDPVREHMEKFFAWDTYVTNGGDPKHWRQFS